MLAENLLISVINVFEINNIDTRSIILFFLLLTYVTSSTIFRSSHRRYSIRKGVLKSSRKFTGKHQCQSLFFNKVAGLRTATLLKKRLGHRCFPVLTSWVSSCWTICLNFFLNRFAVPQSTYRLSQETFTCSKSTIDIL